MKRNSERINNKLTKQYRIQLKRIQYIEKSWKINYLDKLSVSVLAQQFHLYLFIQIQYNTCVNETTMTTRRETTIHSIERHLNIITNVIAPSSTSITSKRHLQNENQVWKEVQQRNYLLYLRPLLYARLLCHSASAPSWEPSIFM